MAPVLRYSVLNKDRMIKSKLKIPITSPRMIHDFLISENHVIFPDLPLEANAKEAIKNKHWMFKFQENRPCRYGIMTKYNTDVNKI